MGKVGWQRNRWTEIGVLVLALLLSAFTCTANHADVFQEDGKIYFLDGDCYSRMTRVRMVLQGHLVIRHHDFENWPTGTTPHTTAPLDWLIAGLKPVCDLVLRVAGSQYASESLDFTGAIVSPLLGMLTMVWLCFWAGRMQLPFRLLLLLYAAVSPILAHAFELGRPDHQSLLVFLLSMSIGAELALVAPGISDLSIKRWSIVAGAGWGMALWTSLYEPAILFVGAVFWLLFRRRERLWGRNVRGRWIALALILLVSIGVDGWRLSWPDPAMREYFGAWSRTITEMQGLDLSKPSVWVWFGSLWVTAPVLLWLCGRKDERGRMLLLLYLLTLGLTLWQVRWSYFMALILAMSPPFQAQITKRAWVCWLAGILMILPLAWSWGAVLYPSPRRQLIQKAARLTQQELRRVAEQIRSSEIQPFLAPWRFSPQIAYWSNQPGVSGSSHEGLSGIVESARFFLETDEARAGAVLLGRQVRWVIVDSIPASTVRPESFGLLLNAANIVHAPATEESMGWRLARTPAAPPPFAQFVSLKRPSSGGGNRVRLFQIFQGNR